MSLEDAPSRFERKVDRRGVLECWPWAGSLNTRGYGLFASGNTNGKRGGAVLVLAHRWAFEFYKATPIPDGMKVLNSCGNNACVNPAHLYLGENAWDLPSATATLDASWVPVARAAERLGITGSGVLRRAAAGRLERKKVRGRVYVRMPE
jgi:hypothetical protein